MNIHEKLCELRKKVSYIQKTEQGAQGVSSSNVLAKVRPAMDELGILLMPSVTKTNTFPKKDYGKPESRELFTEVWMNFEWINAADPKDKIICPWYSQGLDMGEKGIGKAVTYGEKYFILKSLNIPTDKDDPDTFKNKNIELMTKIQAIALTKACEKEGVDITEFTKANNISSKVTTKQEADLFLDNITTHISNFIGA